MAAIPAYLNEAASSVNSFLGKIPIVEKLWGNGEYVPLYVAAWCAIWTILLYDMMRVKDGEGAAPPVGWKEIAMRASGAYMVYVVLKGASCVYKYGFR